MKAYGGSGGIASLILGLGIGRRLVCILEKSPDTDCIGGGLESTAGLGTLEKRKIPY
jgi:hypothetical protein